MARAARYFRLDEINVVNQARMNLEATRDPESNAFDERALIAEVERLMPFDVARERHRKAERIVRDQERPRKTESDGSVWLPGFEPFPYEPNQLMPDGDGKTVERDKATAHFIDASLIRKAKHAEKVNAALARTQAETDGFAEWAADQAAVGRQISEINLGNFIREKGYWQPDEIEDDDEGED